MQKKVVVIGSGPAGLMAAISAAENNCAVTLLEALPSPGRKLLASGAGKCNFTNMLTSEAMAEKFTPAQRRFVRPALLGFPPEAVREFFAARGIKYTLVDDFYCFPASQRAGDILDCLLDELKKYNVQIVCNALVTNIEISNSLVKKVFANNKEYSCDYLIAAGGGPGFPKLGGNGTLDKVMQQCNIACISRTPALCGIKSSDQWLKNLAGIVLDNAELILDKTHRRQGTLLFTGEGVSGPAALDLSGDIAIFMQQNQLENAVIRANWQPDRSREDWSKMLEKARQTNGKRLIHNIFDGTLPQALVNALVERSNLSRTNICNLSRSGSEKLLESLTDCPINVSGVENWSKAMASTGGIDRQQINSRTMQSRQISNLYFAGEFIDVDGPCGGYNIQWALSSGRLAGQLKESDR